MLTRREKILLYGSNLWYLGDGLFGPFLAVFTEKIGGSLFDISGAWATYLIVTGVLIMIIGRISDEKVSKERLMILGYAIYTIFTFCYILVSSPLNLLFVQAGLGVGAALSIPTWDALYAKYEDKKHAGFTWGLAAGESQIILAVAIIIGGFIITASSFNTLFFIMGTIQLIGTIYQAQILL